jgi:hypothetical protein
LEPDSAEDGADVLRLRDEKLDVIPVLERFVRAGMVASRQKRENKNITNGMASALPGAPF